MLAIPCSRAATTEACASSSDCGLMLVSRGGVEGIATATATAIGVVADHSPSFSEDEESVSSTTATFFMMLLFLCQNYLCFYYALRGEL
mmetsp:Transcript_32209/g.59489  ORF Transcript_32209/g.59489 Transcript_32209/m.59489 type:complete len:89 (-) Transcript_32209:17-283(-)